MATLVACGAVGTVVGTRLLVALSSRTVMLILGGFIRAFVALNVTRLSPHLPPRWEPWASPIAGFVAGVVGGITNVPGTPLVIYFYALRLSKPDFVSAVAFTFVLCKVVQLAAVTWYGLFTWSLLGWSLLLTLAALGGFALGLRVQDRLEQQTFNRTSAGVADGGLDLGALAHDPAVAELGIRVRVGLHTSEIEIVGGQPRGVGVHAAARVAALAGPGEVLLSGTTRDLLDGSGLSLESRGEHELKGLSGPRTIFALRR
jgi:Sulfite exporter TauE/SafE